MSVNLATGAVSGGDAAGDTLSGIEQLIGSGFADTLTGNAGANMLWGMGGGDVLTGGGGADVLKGGAGTDRFIYAALADSAVSAAGKDTIRDFSAGDKIDLSAIDADGNPATATPPSASAPAASPPCRADPDAHRRGDRYGVYPTPTATRSPDFASVTADHALDRGGFRAVAVGPRRAFWNPPIRHPRFRARGYTYRGGPIQRPWF